MKENQEISVLVWKDSVTGLTFTVTVRTLIAKNLTHLVVSGPGEEARKVMLDDDVSLATIRFVKSDGWLLVMNDQYAIGGYELTSGKLVGENHWRELPFTVWKGRGSVVAEAKAGQTDRAGTPANFPIINEP